jgi:hypothetical protein
MMAAPLHTHRWFSVAYGYAASMGIDISKYKVWV